MNNQHLSEFLEENKPCSYYDDRLSDIRYKYLDNCAPETYFKMLERGWRRFGNIHFVPECKNCTECQTIRIDVANFKFTKSHKRLFNKNDDIEIYVQKPSISIEHLDLYNKYHRRMQNKKGWNNNEITPGEYKSSYVDGASTYGREILYMHQGKLIGVALSDMLPDGMSAVYCFYDHEYAHRSLGKFSILAQISIAKQANIPYIFL
ncbi:MAG TPA: arginyltransferase, partial [Arcobacter sp.]|nr:arginyltransferase [Arcobacter sp.]